MTAASRKVIDLSVETRDFLTTRASGHSAFAQFKERLGEGETELDLRNMRLVGKAFLDGLSNRLRDHNLAESVTFVTDDGRTIRHLRKLSTQNSVALRLKVRGTEFTCFPHSS